MLAVLILPWRCKPLQIAANKDSKERKAAQIPAPESIRSHGRSSWSCNDGVEDHSPFETCPGRDAEMIIFWYSASLQVSSDYKWSTWSTWSLPSSSSSFVCRRRCHRIIRLQPWRRRRSSRARTALAYMASASRPGCVSEELRSIPQKTDSGKDQSFERSIQVLKKKLKKNCFQVSSKLSLI